MTDPKALVQATDYDTLGRRVRTIGDYTDGVPTSGTNQTTEYGYDGSNHAVQVQADQADGSYQRTQYVYQVTTSAGSAINSNDVLGLVKYPDPATGEPSGSVTQQDAYAVNALGQVLSIRDRNRTADGLSATTHQYAYDALGRLTSDAVAVLGLGVDGAVRRQEAAYDGQGNASLFTTYNAPSGGSIVSQVQRQFNGLGQLTAEFQAHGGAVDPAGTPQVQYGYREMAGGANDSRPLSLTYPDGLSAGAPARVLSYNYASGLDDRLSRLTSLSDGSGVLESYQYLGLGAVVVLAHPQSGVDLSYVKQGAEGTGDAGDPYTGLDRFGRVADQRWLNQGTGAVAARIDYGYDRDGNRTYRQDLSDATLSVSFSELYQYDGLNRLTSFQRGTLNATRDGLVGAATHSQSWALDALGNWAQVTTDGIPVTRSYNAQNEVASGGVSYDGNGNTLADGSGDTFT
jgi:YD repeat-containing protein